ncbi:MAG: zinc ribbon domain-containing protein [Candidatus Eisenbacteria sp.]|nr:zinc ribbon domain-containing protein [Candidatus Eisenbacteria bacterium]
MGLFTTKCQNCGAKVSRRARYCSKCSAIPDGSGQTDRCWKCGHEVSVTSEYCPECKADLRAAKRPEIAGHKWIRDDDAFAVRIEVDDVPGFFKKELYIEPGTRAVFIIDGRISGEVGPGWYTMGGLVGRITGLSAARKMTAILTDAWDSELEFRAANVYTRDPIGLNVTLSMTIAADDVTVIAGKLLADRPSVGAKRLLSLLEPEVRQAVAGFVKSHSAAELDEGATIRADLQRVVAEELAETLKRHGLAFTNIRTLDFFHEELDEQKKTRETYFLQVSEDQAKLEGKQRLFDVKNAADLEGIRQESAQLEVIQKRIDVWGGMIDAAQKMDMKVLRSGADFKEFKRNLDKEELLSGHDLWKLIQDVKMREGREEETRKHLMAVLKMEQFAERERFRLVKTHELSDLEATHALESARKELHGKIDLNRVSVEAAVAEMRTRTDAELERRGKMGAAYRQEAEAAAASRRQISVEDFFVELKKREAAYELERRQTADAVDQAIDYKTRKAELREKERQADHGREQETKELDTRLLREKIESIVGKTGGADAQLLIAALSGVSDEGLDAIKETLRAGQMKDMTPEQIAAMVAEKNPSVLKDLADSMRAKSSDSEKLYERMLVDQKESATRTQEMLERVMKMALETQKDVARGGQGGQGSTVVVSGSGGAPQVVGPQTGQGGTFQAKGCPHCGAIVDAQLNICPECKKPMK